MIALSGHGGVLKVGVARRRGVGFLFRLNRLALCAWMLLYVPMVVGLAAGLGYGGFRLTWWFVESISTRPRPFLWRAGLGVVAADLTILTMIFLLLVGLLPVIFREVQAGLPGIPLRREQHPHLFTLIERLSARVGTPLPDVCVLSPYDNASIGDYSLLRPDGGVDASVRMLVIGAGLVIHQRIDEFATVVAHELAHAAGGDTRFGRFQGRFARSMSAQLGLLTDGDPSEMGWLEKAVHLFLNAYFHVFTLLSSADSRMLERRADRVAARLYGPQNTRNALIGVHLGGHLPELSIEALVIEYSRNERPMSNIFAEHRRRWETISPVRRQKAENEMFMRKASVWSTHPPLAERLRSVADIKAKELCLPKPATKLFGHWESLERQITQVLIGLGRAAHRQHMQRLVRSIGVPQ